MVVDSIERREYAASLKRIFGWVIRGIGRVVTILGALGFVWMLSKHISGGAIPPLIACIGGLKLQLLGRRLSIRNAQVFLERDHRPPVVYLRPFSSDAQTTRFREPDIILNILFRRPAYTAFGLWVLRAFTLLPRLLLAAPRTEEDEIANALKRIGPAVAFSDPDPLSLPPAGLPRLKLNPSCWHEEVAALMSRARLVVLRCGSAPEAEDGYWPRDKSDTISGALGWEIKTAVDCVPPERLILFSAFDGLGYLRFCDKTRAVFPRGLPTWIESRPLTTSVRSVIWFDQNWNATLTPVTWVDTAWRLDSLHPFAKSLSEKLLSILRVQPTLADRLALLAKRFLATVIDYALISAFLLLLLLLLSVTLQILSPDSPLLKAHSRLIFPLLLLCEGIVIVLYEAVLWSSSLMTSFGKRLFGLVVVTSATKPLFFGLVVVTSATERLTFVQALRRSFFKLVLVPVTWVLLLTGSEQTLHDAITNSLVTNRVIRRNEPPRRLFTIIGVLLWISLVWVSLGTIMYLARNPIR